jgi:hypothetical protein
MYKTKSQHLHHRYALAQALNFTDEDLIANQTGKLSDVQQQRLTQNHRSMVWSFEAVFMYGLAFCVLLIGIATLIIVPLSLLCFYIAYHMSVPMLRKYQLLGRDLRAGEVHQIEGNIEIKLVNHRAYGLRYYILLGKERLSVHQTVALTFKNGDPYRLYYLPLSSTVLSVEWLSEKDLFDEDSSENETNHLKTSGTTDASLGFY